VGVKIVFSYNKILSIYKLPHLCSDHFGTFKAVDSLSQERRRDEDRYLAMLKRVFATKHFYFSTELDITSRLQRLHERTLQEESHHRPIWERVRQEFLTSSCHNGKFISQRLIVASFIVI
jgi:hypothetical protein